MNEPLLNLRYDLRYEFIGWLVELGSGHRHVIMICFIKSKTCIKTTSKQVVNPVIGQKAFHERESAFSIIISEIKELDI